jgi:hypothetical protein
LDITSAAVTRYLCSMGRLVTILVGLVLTVMPLSALGETWSEARIARLPDSAFAVVEVAPDGRKLRHLPHHDETGVVDPAHLRAALSRIGQVRWLDPRNAAVARRHLEDHRRDLTGR